MEDDNIELKILESCLDKHKEVKTSGEPIANKCTYELDLKEILKKFINDTGSHLDYEATKWFVLLTESGLLDYCSQTTISATTHKHYVRTPNNLTKTVKRIRELKEKIGNKEQNTFVLKEKEQKFKILLSPTQAEKDFEIWQKNMVEFDGSIAILFLDIDHFKKFNTKHSNPVVDEKILIPAERLLKSIVSYRGEAYKHGGDELIVILPNVDEDEANAFAEKIRLRFESYEFNVNGAIEKLTITSGLVLCQDESTSYSDLLEMACKAQIEAKDEGRNRVKFATLGSVTK